MTRAVIIDQIDKASAVSSACAIRMNEIKKEVMDMNLTTTKYQEKRQEYHMLKAVYDDCCNFMDGHGTP